MEEMLRWPEGRAVVAWRKGVVAAWRKRGGGVWSKGARVGGDDQMGEENG
jgi:hypothetical protein